jgi:chromosome partitioning protein
MSGGVVFFAGTRGGVGKTVMSHAACLGAILHDQPAVYILTDPLRKLRAEGRPYGVLDGRTPRNLSHMLEQSRKSGDGWTIIDGGGNRPAFDEAMAEIADLCILPFRNTDEDLDVVGNDLVRLPKAIAWPTGWPTSPYGRLAARFMLERFSAAFPLRVIQTPLPKVDSSAQLLGESLGSPRTVVRSMARKVFEVMVEEFDHRVQRAAEPASDEATKNI